MTAFQLNLFQPDVSADLSDSLPFERGEMVNAYALSIAEILRRVLGNEYWYNFEFPLQLLCNKGEHTFLPKELWQFWVNSRLDITVMSTKLGQNCRKACLLVECQSPFHDWPDAEQRDHMKANIIRPTGIPLIYVRYADYPRILKFWTDSTEEVFYNPFTGDGWEALTRLIKNQCL
jgi:hypothetical protein